MSLPEWPDTATFIGLPNETKYGDQWLYERARAEAAIARLRIAVEHINHAPRCAMMQPIGRMACDCGYHEALALIGEIPAPPSQEP